jgi:GntR family transcriptional regulator, rspAB operon transcriptional repressor
LKKISHQPTGPQRSAPPTRANASSQSRQLAPSARPRAAKISLASQAYLAIRNKILKGDLLVGKVFSRRSLARELNISVPPITEALLQLEHEGLLESKPRGGTRVRIPTPMDVEDRSVVREALESQAARLFAERATPTEKQELRRMGRHLDRLYAECENPKVDRDFLFSSNACHMSFHLRIAECARCPALRDAIEKEQVLIFNWLFDTAVQRRTLASNFHAILSDALATGTPARADVAMREHIRFGLQQVLAGLGRRAITEGGWRLKKDRSTGA